MAGAGVLLLPIGRSGSPQAQGTTFDFYISPTGSDSNPGTAASPWSITALNTHAAQYRGKRIGLLPGTYNVYALCQAGAWQVPALTVDGGPSASQPTVVQSTVPRQAIITALNPSGGGYPTTECAIIGQGTGSTVANWGNVTLDGIVVTGAYQYGIYFDGRNGTGKVNNEGGASGQIIQNCEVYNISGFGPDNVAGIILWYVTGTLLHNNLVHDIHATSSTHNTGVLSFNSEAITYEYNTFYNLYQAILCKSTPQGNMMVRYNYFEPGYTYTGSNYYDCIQSMCGGMPGETNTVHHNIFVCRQIWDGATSGNISNTGQNSLLLYNNTCYYGAGGFSSGGIYTMLWGSGQSTNPPAMITHYNNIYYSTAPPGYLGIVMFYANSVALSDYNCFQPDAATTNELVIETSVGTGLGTGYSLSAWKANPGGGLYDGVDAHSVAADPQFVSPTSLNPTGYQLGGASPCKGTGRVGGLASGAPCDMGAWGYDPALGGPPAIIGSNFGPSASAVAPAIPAPPLLQSVT